MTLPDRRSWRKYIAMSLQKRIGKPTGLWLLGALVISATAQAQVPKPPPSRVDNFREVVHGVEIIDPYRWLEDQENAETRAWIDAQNKYTHSLLDALPSRPLIQKRLSELLRVDTVSTPFEQDGRYFLFKKRAADDLSILYVRQGLNGKDEVLIDPHTLSADHTTDIGLLDASSGGKLIVYSVRRGGQDETEVHVMDVENAKTSINCRTRFIAESR
jgi:prolyl oligopeptidase